MMLVIQFRRMVAYILAAFLACHCGDPVRAQDAKKPGVTSFPQTLEELQKVNRVPITQVDRPWTPRKYDVDLPFSIEEAIRLGLGNSLAVRSSRLDTDIQDRELIVARSIFDPFFNLSSNYANNRSPTVSAIDVGLGGRGLSIAPSKIFDYSAGLTGTWITGSQYQISVGQVRADRPAQVRGGFSTLNPVVSTQILIEVQQPLLRGAWYAVNTANIRIADNNTLLARKELEVAAINTVARIEQAYWELVFATQNLEAKLSTFRLSLENLENVRKRKAGGTRAAIHVTTAESQTALRRVELDDAQQLVENNRDAFLNAINYTNRKSLKERWQGGPSGDTYENIWVTCTTQPADDFDLADRNTGLALAFANRPEYPQIQLNVQNQKIRIDVAANALLPALDLTAGWAQQGLDENFGTSYDTVGSGDFYDWQVGLQFSIPIGNRAPRNAYMNAKDELRKLALMKEDLETQIVLEVDQTRRAIGYLTQTVQDRKERVRLQTILLAAEVRKLDVGMSIAYTVSLIANDLVDNQTEALRAQTNLQIAISDFYRATGRLLERYKIRLDSAKGR